MARYINARFKQSQIIQRLYNYAGLARGKYERLDIHFGVEHGIHPRTKLSTGAILAINEFGWPAKGIPARPFMRTATPLIAKRIRTLIRQMRARGVPWVGSVEAAQIGDIGRAIIQDTILNWTLPANAPKTILRKGFDDPLLETNLLWKSVAYDVLSHYN